MIPDLRDQFNKQFSLEKYYSILNRICASNNCERIAFKTSESPIFLGEDFKNKLIEASSSLIEQIKLFPPYELEKLVPSEFRIPNDQSTKPHFLQIDFAVSKNEDGEIVPMLIELQGFPGIACFQNELEHALTEEYPFLKSLKSSTSKELISLLQEVVIGEEDTENVIILDVFPNQQGSWIDLIISAKQLEIQIVCSSKIICEDRKLYYEHNNRKIVIKRIFNRMVLEDLLQHPDILASFDPRRNEYDVKWITHPNWFFKISKALLPVLKHECVPKAFYLQDFPDNEKLEDFVLKPLFSYMGKGVDLHPSKEKVNTLHNPSDYLLQERVKYWSLFKDVNEECSSAEIRLLFIWEEQEANPTLVGNFVRMSKSQMMNLNCNSYDLWIGCSVFFFTCHFPQ